MLKMTRIAALVIAVAGLSGTAMAQDFDKEIKARQAVMNLYSFNLGILGGMAKGSVDYDAGAAQNAANNLKALVTMQNGAMWPMGSDASSVGDKTRAKAENWTSYPDAAKIHKELIAASTKMAAEAGNGVDAIRANIGAIGATCKSCHTGFRAAK